MLENRPHLQAEAVGDGKAYRSPLVINTARGNRDEASPYEQSTSVAFADELLRRAAWRPAQKHGGLSLTQSPTL